MSKARPVSLQTAIPVFVASLTLSLFNQTLVAVVTPNPTYTVDFDSASDVDDFGPYVQTAPVNNAWTMNGGAWEHQFTSNGGGGSTVGQLVQTSGVVGTNFTLSTDFTVTSRNTGDVDWLAGLAVLTNGNLGQWDGSASWYMAAVRFDSPDGGTVADSLDIVQDNAQYGASVIGGDQPLGFNLAVGTLYRLSVTGTYVGPNSLVLSTTLTDVNTPTNTLTVTTAPIAGPKSGAYFGYAEVGFFGSGGTIQYDNFTLSVPEPASLVLLGAVGLLNGVRPNRRV